MGCPRGPINLLCLSFFARAGQPFSFVQLLHVFSRAISLVRPAPQAFPRPDPRNADAGARRSGQGWRVAPPRRSLSLNGFEHAGTLERVGGNDEVRGELRVGARRIVPHPCMRRGKNPDHDAVIRISSESSEAAGPFLITAFEAMANTGPRHLEPSSATSSQAVADRARNRQRSLCTLLSVRRTQDNALGHYALAEKTPECDEQLARQSNYHFLAQTSGVGGAGEKPLGQGAVFLELQKAPRQQDHAAPHSRVAGLREAFLPMFVAACVG